MDALALDKTSRAFLNNAVPTLVRTALCLDRSVDELATVDVLLNYPTDTWTVEKTIAVFGHSCGFDLGKSPISFCEPRLNLVRRPWLIHPEEIGTYVRLFTVGSALIRDVVWHSGTISSTSRTGELPVSVVTPDVSQRELYTHEIRTKSDNRAIVLFTNDPMAGVTVAHRRLRCVMTASPATYTSERTSTSELVRTATPAGELLLVFSNACDLFRIAVTLPSDVYLDMTGVESRDTVRRLASLTMGAINDWRLIDRRLKVLVTEAQMGAVNFLRAIPEAVPLNDVLPRVPVLNVSLRFDRPSTAVPHLNEVRPLLYKKDVSGGGVCVFSFHDKLITYGTDVYDKVVVERDFALPPVSIRAVLEETRVRIAGPTGSCAFHFADASFPTETFSDDFYHVVVADDDDQLPLNATVVTSLGYNKVVIAHFSAEAICHFFYHAAALEDRRFVVDARGLDFAASVIYEMFVKIRDLGGAGGPLDIHCLVDPRWRPPYNLLGGHFKIDMGTSWRCALKGPASVIPRRGPPVNDSSVEFREWAAYNIEYEPTAIASRNHATWSDVRCNESDTTARDKMALSLMYATRYSKTDGAFYVSAPAEFVRAGSGRETAPVALMKVEYHAPGLTVPSWTARSPSCPRASDQRRGAVVGGTSKVDHLEDVSVAVVCAHLLGLGQSADAILSNRVRSSDLSAGMTLNFTTARDPAVKRRFVESLGMWYATSESVADATVSTYYDETIAAGLAIGALVEQPSRRFTEADVTDPSACVANFMEAVYFPQTDELSVGDAVASHFLKVAGDDEGEFEGAEGIVSYVALTTRMVEIARGVVFCTRSGGAGAMPVVSTPGAFRSGYVNRAIVSQLMSADTADAAYEAYASMFGPVVVCRTTPLLFACETEGVPDMSVAVVSRIVGSRQNGEIHAVPGAGTGKICVYTGGSSTLYIVDGKVAYVDATAPPIALLTTKTRYSVETIDEGVYVCNPAVDKVYRVSRTRTTPAKELLRCRIKNDADLRAANVSRTGQRDPVTDLDAYRDYPRIDADGVSHASLALPERNNFEPPTRGRGETGEAGPGRADRTKPKASAVLSHAGVDDDTLIVTVDRANTKVYSVSQPNNTSDDPFTEFTAGHNVVIRFPDAPCARWYVRNVMRSISGREYVRGTTLVTYRHENSVLYPAVMLDADLAYGINGLVIVSMDFLVTDVYRSASAGLYVKKYPKPWDNAVAVTDARLIVSVLVTMMQLCDYVKVIVRDTGLETPTLSYALELAPLFLTPKRVRVTGRAPSIAAATVQSLPQRTMSNAVVGATLTVKKPPGADSARTTALATANVDVRWLQNDSTDATDATLVARSDTQFVIRFTSGAPSLTFDYESVGSNLKDYVCALAARGAIKAYADPTNREFDVRSEMWFERVMFRGRGTVVDFLVRLTPSKRVYEMSLAEFESAMDDVDVDVLRDSGVPVAAASGPPVFVCRSADGHYREDVAKKWRGSYATDSRRFLADDLGVTDATFLTLTNAASAAEYVTTDTDTSARMKHAADSNEHVFWLPHPRGTFVRLTESDYAGVRITPVDTLASGSRISVHPTRGAEITCASSPVDIFQAIWSMHGLGGDEPVLVTNSSNEDAVIGAVRLWLFTFSNAIALPAPTFIHVNVCGTRYRHRADRDAFTRKLTRSFVNGPYDETLVDVKLIEGTYVPPAEPKDQTLRRVDETSRELADNAKIVFDLKRGLLSMDPGHWSPRLIYISRQLPKGERWVGRLALAPPRGVAVSRELIAQQNRYHTTLESRY